MQVKRNVVGSFSAVYILSMIAFFINACVSTFRTLSYGYLLSSNSIVYSIFAVISIIIFIKALLALKRTGQQNATYLMLFYVLAWIINSLDFIFYDFYYLSPFGLWRSGDLRYLRYITITVCFIIALVIYIWPIIFVHSYFKKPRKAVRVLSLVSIIVVILFSLFTLVYCFFYIHTGTSSGLHYNADWDRDWVLSTVGKHWIEIIINIIVCSIVAKVFTFKENNYAASGSTYDKSAVDEVMFLKSQLDNGVISQKEFDAKKKELLGL